MQTTDQMRPRRMGRVARRALALGVLCLGLGACSAQYANHGYVPAPEDIEQITIGVDTRATVQEVLGSALAAGVVSDGAVYYVRSRVRSVGLFAPQVSEREVVAISFAADDTVRNIETFGLQDGQVVPLSRRVTSSGVENKTFLRQLLGNVGRFNPGAFGS